MCAQTLVRLTHARSLLPCSCTSDLQTFFAASYTWNSALPDPCCHQSRSAVLHQHWVRTKQKHGDDKGTHSTAHEHQTHVFVKAPDGQRSTGVARNKPGSTPRQAALAVICEAGGGPRESGSNTPAVPATDPLDKCLVPKRKAFVHLNRLVERGREGTCETGRESEQGREEERASSGGRKRGRGRGREGERQRDASWYEVRDHTLTQTHTQTNKFTHGTRLHASLGITIYNHNQFLLPALTSGAPHTWLPLYMTLTSTF